MNLLFGRRLVPWLCVVVLTTACAATGAPGSAPPAVDPADPTPSVTPETGTESTPTPIVTVDVPVFVDENGFDDHTVPTIDSVPEFFALAESGVNGQSVVKFSIPDLLGDPDGRIHWFDSGFYELHDEWYWFRLLNGQRAPNIDVEPVPGNRFASIDEIYAWAERLDPVELPLDLYFADSRYTDRPRLFSQNYYDEALDVAERNYLVGSLVHLQSDVDGNPRWLVQLEYTDEPDAADVAAFMQRLAATVPPEIGDALEWVVRSPAQERLAQQMAAGALPYADRIVRYSEIVAPGEVGVYNEGIAVGRLLLVEEGGARLTDAIATDIVIVENVPDYLPPASALLTSEPQTPLAHVNLLARNRSIPNASQSGLLDDPGIRQAARIRAHVVVRASGDDHLEVVPISREEYDEWQALVALEPIGVTPVDVDDIPTVVALDELADTIDSEAEIEPWRPIVGGKAAGFLTLLAADRVTAPDRPLAITVAPYVEHLVMVRSQLDAMLANEAFVADARIRFLLLEGLGDFEAFYPDDVDRAVAQDFIDTYSFGTPMADIIASGGFKRLLRDQPVDRAVLDAITDALEENFGDYADSQGLRFRSSSSVEDIEGFSGAGLYDSNTGYLDPTAAADPGDRDHDVEWALKKTWASYWGFEAFEERRLENVDHLSGAMAVVVHARFDDELEANNGVATFTLLEGVSDDATATAIINVQAGAVSVTNPDPAEVSLPEVIEVSQLPDGSLRTDRRATSTLSPGQPVLDDDAVAELFAQLQSVTLLWRAQINADLPPLQQIDTVTLDFEFKTVDDGWPALRSGEATPGRLVVKQARSLDPGLRGVPQSLRDQPIPRDVLARARLVERVDCPTGDGATVITIEVFTDPLRLPDMGFGVDPFVVGDGGRADDTECARSVLYATPDQYLLELIEREGQLDLTG